jgi:large subunit ribosomal protein L15
MNELSSLAPPEGAHKARRRVGRGPGSGFGKTCGRGQKGQKARAASKKRPGFEGGQMPLQRRVPKRGFTPLSRTRYTLLSLADLAQFGEGTEVTPELLLEKGFLNKATDLVKVLANGELTIKLTVKAHKFSKTAASKIEAAGGTTEVIGG